MASRVSPGRIKPRRLEATLGAKGEIRFRRLIVAAFVLAQDRFNVRNFRLNPRGPSLPGMRPCLATREPRPEISLVPRSFGRENPS